MLSLLLAHKELRSVVLRDLFSSRKLRLNLRPHENKIEVLKEHDDITISYPYHLSFDTLQRLIFHLAAIMSNQESTLIFEEPESHGFPYYTNYLAETIARDEQGTQYFMSTHNPYFLVPLVAKALKEDIAVFITYFEDYQTRVKRLTEAQLQQLA